MSYTLDVLLDQASDGLTVTARLSSIDLAVFMYASGFLDKRRLWLDIQNDPFDEVTDADWVTIQEIVSNAMRSLMTPDVGKISPYMTEFPPAGTLECDGGIYNRVDFPLLYAALDTVFVIDADTFYVPDLRGRIPLGVGTGSGLSSYAMGDEGGEETHTLVGSETPVHSHSDAGHTHTEVTAIPTAITIGAGVPAPSALPSVGATGIGFASLDSFGGDGAHENRQPYLALRFCVQAV